VASAITPRTRAILATHLFGYPLDVERLAGIVDDAERRFGHRIIVVQDCAHAFNARRDGKLVAAERDVALFGLNVSKMITSVFGGMMTTDDAELARTLRAYRDATLRTTTVRKSLQRRLYLLTAQLAFERHVYGLVDWLDRETPLLDRWTKAYHLEDAIVMPPDYDERMTDVEARVGLAQLARLEGVVRRRREHAAAYADALGDVPGIVLPARVDGATYSHYVVLVEDRPALLRFARHRGVQLGQLIEYVVPEFEAYAPYRTGGPFPRAAWYAEHAVNLPIHGAMTAADRARVIKVVRAGLHSARASAGTAFLARAEHASP
jgi:dTDP-4-amino-4,6-dideoxygalactose transaminase